VKKDLLYYLKDFHRWAGERTWHRSGGESRRRKKVQALRRDSSEREKLVWTGIRFVFLKILNAERDHKTPE